MQTDVFPIIPGSSAATTIMIVLAGVLVIMAILTVLLPWSINHARVEVTRDGVRIRGDMYGRFFSKSDLVIGSARIVSFEEEPNLRPKMRLNGIGLPGYASGWFRLRNNEKALLFVTKDKAVYIPTNRDYVLMLSPEDQEIFLEKLKQLQ